MDRIERFAEKFGLHPDSVYKSTSFGTFTNYLIKWKEDGEFRDRYNEIERLINSIK